MKQKFKMIALGIVLTTIVFSCSENDPNSKDSAISREEGVAIELGKRLENPYSVSNMKKALANLRKSKRSV